MSTQTHDELYVRPHHCQVEEGADHAPVLLLVHGFSTLISIHHRSRTHQCQHQLGVAHRKLSHHVLRVLALVYERPVLVLLDLKPKEKLQLAHHGHLKLPAHILCKLGKKIVR